MKTRGMLFVSILALLSLLATPFSASAREGQAAPFDGAWIATDIDGGVMRLAIGGPPDGPFQITWTEAYFGFCQGGPGIARGTGYLSAGDPYVVEASLHLECFTTGQSVDFYPVWRYDPLTETLNSLVADPVLTTWYRHGVPLPQADYQIIAHPDQDWVEGMGFAEGTIVNLYIVDAQGSRVFNGSVVAGYLDYDPTTVRAEFSVGYDMQAGDHLWMTDGRTIKDIVVANIAISAVDQNAKTVSGTAAPGSEIFVEFSPDAYFSVTTGADGVWSASIAEMWPATWGLISQQDADYDLTRLVFYLPYPRMVAFPVFEMVEGFEWPLGAEVTLTIDNPGTVEQPDFTRTETAATPDWYPATGLVSFNFEGTYNLTVGDIVRMTDGVNEQTHTVMNLGVTGADEAENTVSGTADAFTEVHVWPHGYPEIVTQASDAGLWAVDFDDIGIDLQPEMDGRSEVRDEMGNATAVDWRVP